MSKITKYQCDVCGKKYDNRAEVSCEVGVQCAGRWVSSLEVCETCAGAVLDKLAELGATVYPTINAIKT